MGTTRETLRTKMEEHMQDIWSIATQTDGDIDMCRECSPEGGNNGPHNAFAQSPLAAHFAMHCKNAQTKEEAIQICHKTIKVERRAVVNSKKRRRSSTIMKIIDRLGFEL